MQPPPVHFFKVKTRLGMAHLPFKGARLNIGVEEGSEAVLDRQFLAELAAPEVDEYTFSLPENLSKKDFYAVLGQELKELEDLISSKLRPGHVQLTIGGDHSLSFASILSVLKRVPDPSRLGYIQFDSHPDLLTRSASTTKNFHGMYLRPLVKTNQGVDFDIPGINRLVKNQLLPENMLFIGNLDQEAEERRFVADREIKNITRWEILNNRDQILRSVEEFIGRFDYLHLNFDVDVFDRSLVSATGCPSPSGLFKEEIFPLLEIISRHPNLSLDLVEVNPKRNGSTQTVAVAQSVLRSIIKVG